MPNIWIEYTANLKAEAHIPALLNRLGQFLIAYGGGDVFPPGGTRLRGVEITDYYMADGEEDYAYVHLEARIGPGRPPEQMRRAFDEVFEILKDHFKDLYDRRLLALYMEVSESDAAWSWRHNNVHKHMQAKRAALAAERAEG